jgi:hypothetical protein
MSSLIIDLSAQQLRQAAQIKDKILSLEKKLGRIIGSIPASSNATPSRKKFRMSAAARAKISAAAKARWAKIKGRKVKTTLPVRKVKRTLSATARAKIAAAAKARWAKAKAAGRKSL